MGPRSQNQSRRHLRLLWGVGLGAFISLFLGAILMQALLSCRVTVRGDDPLVTSEVDELRQYQRKCLSRGSGYVTRIVPIEGVSVLEEPYIQRKSVSAYVATCFRLSSEDIPIISE